MPLLAGQRRFSWLAAACSCQSSSSAIAQSSILSAGVAADLAGDRRQLLARDAGVVEHALQRRVLRVDRADQRRLRGGRPAPIASLDAAPERERIGQPLQPRDQRIGGDAFGVARRRRRGEQAVHRRRRGPRRSGAD